MRDGLLLLFLPMLAGIPHPARAAPLDRIIEVADRWVDGWLEDEWDAGGRHFRFPQGPYSDAFEHDYVGAVLFHTDGSRHRGSPELARRVIADLLHHARVILAECRDKGVRGYWRLNGLAARGVAIGSASWQSRAFIRSGMLLEDRMAPDDRRVFREAARWLVAALTVDFRETMGPWWSTNKVAEHLAGVGHYFWLSGDERARKYLDEQFSWFWRAFPEDGCADKYLNYFVKTLYRLAPILQVPGLERWRGPIVSRIRLFRSLVDPKGLFDLAGHHEPIEGGGMGKIGPLMALFLLASPEDADLAVAARHMLEARLRPERPGFWPHRFDRLLGGHWGCLGLMIETAPSWQRVLEGERRSWADLAYFDCWRGLGNVAVKTRHYQASSYLVWGWTFDFPLWGGVLWRLNTPGRYRDPDFPREGLEIGRAWLDWTPHADPETGRERNGPVVAIAGGRKFSAPPPFPDVAIAIGDADAAGGRRLVGFAHAEYPLAGSVDVRSTSVYLEEGVLELLSIEAARDVRLDALYVTQELSNAAGDLEAWTDAGQRVSFRTIAIRESGRTLYSNPIRPAKTIVHPFRRGFDLRPRDASTGLALGLFSKDFTACALRDIALARRPRPGQKRSLHRVEAWRGHLATALRKGEVLRADFALLPHPIEASWAHAMRDMGAVAGPSHHGVSAGGERTVIAVQVDRESEVAGFRVRGRFLAVELVRGRAARVILWGEGVDRGGRPLLALSRPGVVMLAWERREVRCAVDASPGCLDITFAAGPRDFTRPSLDASRADVRLVSFDRRTRIAKVRLRSDNHEFLMRPMVSQRFVLREGGSAAGSAPARKAPASRIPDPVAACRRFARLPSIAPIAVEARDVAFMLELARIRGEGRGEAPFRESMARARAERKMARAEVARGRLERAHRHLSRAKEAVLAAHAALDGLGAVSAEASVSIASPLPPRVSGQDRFELAYVTSFAEEGLRRQAMARVRRLVSSLSALPEAAEFTVLVGEGERRLLREVIGPAIHWTRAHVPGSPELLWRPFLEGQGRLSRWEEGLVRYLGRKGRIALVLERARALSEALEEAVP